ncbi:hypothetical protein [Paraburkholderia panacisoli]|uniref:hypothetical protein n=1 Tax=Paraburkholderia panacisoli TaxID=2603818 RepID=UPI00165F8611|nr:hypothetical protein [Paraburkholderia panacisoli]
MKNIVQPDRCARDCYPGGKLVGASGIPGALSCMDAPGLPSFTLRWFKGLDCSHASGRLWCNSGASVCYSRAFDDHEPMSKLKDLEWLFNVLELTL